MADPLTPPLPDCLLAKSNRFSRGVGRALLRLLGWRLEGSFPEAPKVMVALGPHTSNWDFVVAMAAILASGIQASYLMKKEAFVWPFSRLYVWLGGVPLNRKSATNTVEQLVSAFNRHDKLWVAIAPEGTRQKVGYWKTGFLRVAHQAQVPVLTVAWDYERKALVLDKLWHASEHYEQDAQTIREHVRSNFKGRHPHLQ